MSQPTNYTSNDKTFQALQKLAVSNPQAFELKRDEIINEFIRSIPQKYQQRMVCLQWSIDRIRDRAKTPLEACIAISNLMFDSVNKLHKQAREIQCEISGEKNKRKVAKKSEATILDFKVPCDESA